MRMFLVALMALFVATGTPALAQSTSWRVSEVGGDVRIVEGGRSRPATRGALLAGGSVVTTAQRARAVLVRGRDYVIVSPASRVRVPTAAQGGRGGLVQMISEAGTSLFRIEHRATPHFAVRTPYLAAVVKGTVFTVTVSAAGASVQVTEGAVEVSTADGGAAEMVRPGTIATVSAADLQLLNIQGENSRSIRSNGAPAADAVTVPPSEVGNYQGPADSQEAVVASVREEPVALAEVTGGLVEGNAGVDLALADVRDAVRPDAGGHGEAGHGGNGGGNDNSGPGNNNGGGNDAGASGDDGNNGQGNDDDGDDAGNSGNGGGNGNSGPGNNNGNDDDTSGPGNGNSGPGNNNGGGNDADDDNSGPGNGGDDGNNGHGNDDDGDDASNPGNGGGNGNSGPGNGGDDDADDDNSGPGNGGHGGHGGGHGGGNGDDD